MRFDPIAVEGAFIVTLDGRADERGTFSRTFCVDEFRAAGIEFVPVQCNLSRNTQRGTLRGMHFQRPPHEEAKLVQCVRGAIFDAIVDLRRGSPSFRKAAWVELSDRDNRLIYIPAGCAHGFLTLAPDSDVFYYMGSPFVPDSGAGIRWDDPELAVPWPDAPTTISERDSRYPTLSALEAEMFS